MVAELDGVDGVHLEAEELEGEGRRLVADIAGHDMGLDGKNPPGAAVVLRHL